MNYYSTNKTAPRADFREAALLGQAPDKGLYFPEKIPQLQPEFAKQLPHLSKAEIAYDAIKPYTGSSIPERILQQIVEETLDFELPLVELSDETCVMELFHGPTLSFKDVGARFMSRCLSYFAGKMEKKIVVLVATSGDTGSAVAHGFLNREGVEVVILYPSGKVSQVQELQLTTLGNNVKALEIKGDFDDCQRMVKQAFADEEHAKRIFLTSANSINVARWLPQQFFYFLALQQWTHKEQPVVVVPSGNFGNICSGMLGKESGLGIKHFVAACNKNNVVTRYLLDGSYSPKPTVHTISNAMDVGNPSNFVRIQELYKRSDTMLKRNLSSFSVNDEQTATAMLGTLSKYDYQADPHTAVGLCALDQYREKHPGTKGIIMATAHPVKFAELVKKITDRKVAKTEQILELEKLKKESIVLPPDYEALKGFLERY